MKIVDIYGWGLPKQADFLSHFKNNDTLYNQARVLWSKLDACTVWFIVAFVVRDCREMSNNYATN